MSMSIPNTGPNSNMNNDKTLGEVFMRANVEVYEYRTKLVEKLRSLGLEVFDDGYIIIACGRGIYLRLEPDSLSREFGYYNEEVDSYDIQFRISDERVISFIIDTINRLAERDRVEDIVTILRDLRYYGIAYIPYDAVGMIEDYAHTVKIDMDRIVIIHRRQRKIRYVGTLIAVFDVFRSHVNEITMQALRDLVNVLGLVIRSVDRERSM